MKILLYTHQPGLYTGFAHTSRMLCEHWTGVHEVYVLPLFGGPLEIHSSHGATILPSNGALSASAEWCAYWVKTLGIDLVIQHFDVWMLPVGWARGISCPVITYSPVDARELPKDFIDACAGVEVNVAMSPHAGRIFASAELPWTYIPHAVEVGEKIGKKTARKTLNLPEEAFIIGIVATNGSGRKNIAGQMEAFALALQASNHKDMYLYLHTQVNKTTNESYDIEYLAERLGISDRVITTNSEQYAIGWPKEMLRMLYASFDVLMQCSLGEGFGLPMIEAQAEGTPVIASGHTGHASLLESGGVVVNEGVFFTMPYSSAAMFIPKMEAIAEILTRMVEEPRYYGGIVAGARKNAKRFEMGKILPLWDDLIGGKFSIKGSQAAPDYTPVNIK